MGTPGEMQEERTENRDRGRIGISQHEVWGGMSHIFRKSELLTKYPNKGKLIPVPQWKTGSACQEGGTGPAFSFGTRGGGKKEANRNKFTKLCFLLFEIGKGSLGNNDQV